MSEQLGIDISLNPKLDRNGLEQAKKEAENSGAVHLPVEFDVSSSSIKDVEKKLGKQTLKFDIDDKVISDYRKKLKSLGFSDIAIDEAVAGLKKLDVQVTKVQAKIQEINQDGQKLKAIILEGVRAEGELVKITQKYDKSKKQQLVTEYDITHEYEKQAKAQKSAAEEASKYVTKQRNALRDLESKAETGAKKLSDAYSGEFKSIVKEIENALDGVGDEVTTEVENKISTLMANAKRAMREAQNKEYVATSLRTKDFKTVKDIEKNNLNTFIADAKKDGVFTDEVEKQVKKLRTQLNKAADADSLTKYLNNLDVLKSRVGTIKSELDGLEKQKKEQAKVQEEAAKAARQEAEEQEKAAKSFEKYVKDTQDYQKKKDKEREDYSDFWNKSLDFKNTKEQAVVDFEKEVQQLKELDLYVDEVADSFELMRKNLDSVDDGEGLKNWTADFKHQKKMLKDQVDAAKELREVEEKNAAARKKAQEEQIDFENRQRAQKEKEDAQYQKEVSKLFNVQDQKAVQQNQLEERIGQLKELGIYSGDIQDKFENLRTVLDSVGDSDGLTAYSNQLKRVNSEIEESVKLAKESKAKADAEQKAEEQYYADQEKRLERQKQVAEEIVAANEKAAQSEVKNRAKQQREYDKLGSFLNQKDSAQLDLDKKINDLKQLGIYSGETKEKFDLLGESLKNLGDGSELRAWKEQFSLLNKEAEKYLSTIEAQRKLTADSIESSDGGQLAKIASLQKSLSGFDNTAGFNALRGQLETLSAEYSDVVDKLRNTDIPDEKFADLQTRLAGLDQELNRVSNSLKKFNGDAQSQQYMDRMNANVQKLKSNFAAMKENWSKATEIPELRAEIEKLDAAMAGLDAANLPQVSAQFQSLRAKIRAAGADVKSFAGELKDMWNEFAQFFTMHDLWQYAKEFTRAAVENVKNLDSAMVELKKVTDLTAQSYDKFLKRAGDTAHDIGTSITEFINSTAD